MTKVEYDKLLDIINENTLQEDVDLQLNIEEDMIEAEQIIIIASLT